MASEQSCLLVNLNNALVLTLDFIWMKSSRLMMIIMRVIEHTVIKSDPFTRYAR